VRRTCGVLLAARPLSARRPQDAQAAGAADAPPPAAPEGFWAAEAALLAGARAELTRLGLARGLAASLPASALATAVRGGACMTFVHWLHCGPDVKLHAAAAPCGQRPTPSHVRGTQCRPACKRNLQKWKCAAPQAVCASGTGMRRALGRLGCHTCETSAVPGRAPERAAQARAVPAEQPQARLAAAARARPAGRARRAGGAGAARPTRAALVWRHQLPDSAAQCPISRLFKRQRCSLVITAMSQAAAIATMTLGLPVTWAGTA